MLMQHGANINACSRRSRRILLERHAYGTAICDDCNPQEQCDCLRTEYLSPSPRCRDSEKLFQEPDLLKRVFGSDYAGYVRHKIRTLFRILSSARAHKMLRDTEI